MARRARRDVGHAQCDQDRIVTTGGAATADLGNYHEGVELPRSMPAPTLLAREAPETLPEWAALLDQLNQRAHAIDDIVAAFSHEHGGEQFADVRWWTSSLLKEARNYHRDLNLLTPWANLPVTNLSLTGRELDAAVNWRTIQRELQRVPSLSELIRDFRPRAGPTGGVSSGHRKEFACSPIATRPSKNCKPSLSALEQAAEAARAISNRIASAAA